MSKVKKIYRQKKTGVSASDTYVPIDDGSHELQGKPIEDFGGGASFQEFVAIMNQSGTSAPTLTVIYNDFSSVPVFTRSSSGQYATNWSEIELANTIMTIQSGYDDGYGDAIVSRSLVWNNQNALVTTQKGDGSYTDDRLNHSTLIIRKYS